MSMTYPVPEEFNKLIDVIAEYHPGFKNVSRYKFANTNGKGHFYRNEAIEVYIEEENCYFKGKCDFDGDNQVYITDGKQRVYIKPGMKARFYINDKMWLD